MPLLSLRHGPLHLDLLPEAGGSIARCYSTADGTPRQLLRPASTAAIAQRRVEEMACFPMLPLCGRLRHGQFRLPHGEPISLPSAYRARHFLHGIGWQRPWTVLEYGGDSATLQLEVEEGAGPYRFTATQKVVLNSSQVRLNLSIRSEAAQVLPYGIGLHPYFPRYADSLIQGRIAGLWQADTSILPLFPEPANTLTTAMAVGLRPDDWPLDNTAYGWGRELTISHGAMSLQLQASESANLLTVYTPPGQDFFCLEPCTQVPDFPNLADYPAVQTGGHWLAPGETLAFDMRLDLERE